MARIFSAAGKFLMDSLPCGAKRRPSTKSAHARNPHVQQPISYTFSVKLSNSAQMEEGLKV